MSQKILQINFKYHLSRAEYETAVMPVAEPIAAVPGLLWKVWLMNAAEQESGGIYLFAERPSFGGVPEQRHRGWYCQQSGLSDFSVKQFEVMADVSEVTRGPLATAEAARHL